MQCAVELAAMTIFKHLESWMRVQPHLDAGEDMGYKGFWKLEIGFEGRVVKCWFPGYEAVSACWHLFLERTRSIPMPCKLSFLSLSDIAS